jgi:agmatinase
MAIIDASQYLELYDLELDREIYQVGIHTLPEVQTVMSGPEGMVHQVYQVARELLEAGKTIVMLGGEHSLTLGMVQAYQEKYKGLSVLQLDAHADLRDEYLGTPYSHACVMRRVWECCPIVQVGIRSLSSEEHLFLQQQGLVPFYMEEFAGERDSVARVVSSLSDIVYITIDLDVLDPSVMSAVGTPEPGGMGWYELVDLVRAVSKQKRVVGFDLVEFCPREGPTSCAFLAAKLAYRLIGYITSAE